MNVKLRNTIHTRLQKGQLSLGEILGSSISSSIIRDLRNDWESFNLKADKLFEDFWATGESPSEDADLAVEGEWEELSWYRLLSLTLLLART